MKINSASSISRGLSFGSKFVSKKNKDIERSEHGSSIVNIKDPHFIETSVQEFPEPSRSEQKRRKGNAHRISGKASPGAEANYQSLQHFQQP